jgi:hypothetical protein
MPGKHFNLILQDGFTVEKEIHPNLKLNKKICASLGGKVTSAENPNKFNISLGKNESENSTWLYLHTILRVILPIW